VSTLGWGCVNEGQATGAISHDREKSWPDLSIGRAGTNGLAAVRESRATVGAVMDAAGHSERGRQQQQNEHAL
jgi:hypothetical protein